MQPISLNAQGEVRKAHGFQRKSTKKVKRDFKDKDRQRVDLTLVS